MTTPGYINKRLIYYWDSLASSYTYKKGNEMDDNTERIKILIDGMRKDLDKIEDLLPEEPHTPDTPGRKLIGNLSKHRYPNMDEGDCTARSVLDMQVCDDKLYISGGGDMYNNRGPVDIFMYDGINPILSHELQEEQISRLVRYDDILLIPGDDRIGGGGGSFYVLNEIDEIKAYSVTKSSHVQDVAMWEDRYYAIGDRTRLVRIGDAKKVIALGDNDTRFDALCTTAEGLFMWGIDDNIPCIWQVHEDGVLEMMSDFPYPGLQDMFNRPSRVVAWSNGALYTSTISLATDTIQSKRLFYFENGSVSVQGVLTRFCLKDIVVDKDDKAFMLAASDNNCTTTVLNTNFNFIFEENFDAVPYSLEYFNDKFYIGFGNARNQALEHSGELWEITV